MRLLKCPNNETLLEFHSIPNEIRFFSKAKIRSHLLFCNSCKESLARIDSLWSSYFTPKPDVTSSLLRVYSKLQSDETLILKGWKLGESRRQTSLVGTILKEGWVFRGAVSLSLFGLILFVVVTQLKSNTRQEAHANLANLNKAPLAQIRVEDRNSLKVHYLEPELLQTIEFETTLGGR